MSKYYILSVGASAVFLVTYATYGLAFWFGASLVSDGLASPGTVFTVFFSMLSGAVCVGNALPFLNSVLVARGSLAGLRPLLTRTPCIDSSSPGRRLLNLHGAISFNNVSFAYPSRPDQMVLKEVSLEVKAGQTVALVGASGAGKSSMVQLVLRFYDVSSGQVCVDGVDVRELSPGWLRCQVGLVSQEPALFSGTIADNISLGELDRGQVVAAATIANAHSFIQQLPMGYDTVLGEGGAQLSGGQRQRVAVARAVGKQPSILLLDEATSALDSESEAEVQRGLEAAQQGRTTVIVAHRLSTVRHANLIIALKDGKICEQGTHEDLMSKQGYYYNMVVAQSLGVDPAPTIPLGSPVSLSGNPFGASLVSSSSTCSIDDIKNNKKWLRGMRDILRLFRYNKPEWPWLVMCVFSCTVIGAVPPTYAYFYSEMFSTLMMKGEMLKSHAVFWSSMIVCLGVISGCAYGLMILSSTAASEKLIARMRLMVMERVVRQPVETFDLEEYSPGKVMTRLSHDLPLIKSAGGMRLGYCVTASVTLTTAVCLAFMTGWQLAAFLSAGVPLLVAATCYQYSLLRASHDKDIQLMHLAGAVASECVRNIRTVQSLCKERYFLALYSDHLHLPFRESKKQAGLYAVFYSMSQTVVYLMYAAGFYYGAYLIESGEMKATSVYRVFFCLSFCATAVGQSMSYLQDFSRAKLALKTAFQILDKKSAVDPLSEYGVKPVIRGRVEVRGVEFSYPAREEAEVLRGLNLDAEAGHTLAIVGPSGSGKSTLLQLLQRFYQPGNGFIAIDGVDIRAMNVSYLRHQLGVVSQEPELMATTIRENIAYGRPNTPMADIIAAAQTANAHTFITQLPRGYDTVVGGACGSQLSGGEKQRVCLARAVLSNPKILLLDEPTSALDTISEKAVQEGLEHARRGRTCIIVAHRLSTVRSADKIVVMTRGQVVEEGTHQELMDNHKHYYQLVHQQDLLH